LLATGEEAAEVLVAQGADEQAERALHVPYAGADDCVRAEGGVGGCRCEPALLGLGPTDPPALELPDGYRAGKIFRQDLVERAGRRQIAAEMAAVEDQCIVGYGLSLLKRGKSDTHDGKKCCYEGIRLITLPQLVRQWEPVFLRGTHEQRQRAMIQYVEKIT